MKKLGTSIVLELGELERRLLHEAVAQLDPDILCEKYTDYYGESVSTGEVEDFLKSLYECTYN